MPLLATYTFAGAASLASGNNCLAHGLPTQPDWGYIIPVSAAGAAAPSSIPIGLVSMTNAHAVWANPNGTAVNAEMVAQFVHAIGR